jgi:hypothetical protein
VFGVCSLAATTKSSESRLHRAAALVIKLRTFHHFDNHSSPCLRVSPAGYDLDLVVHLANAFHIPYHALGHLFQIKARETAPQRQHAIAVLTGDRLQGKVRVASQAALGRPRDGLLKLVWTGPAWIAICPLGHNHRYLISDRHTKKTGNDASAAVGTGRRRGAEMPLMGHNPRAKTELGTRELAFCAPWRPNTGKFNNCAGRRDLLCPDLRDKMTESSQSLRTISNATLFHCQGVEDRPARSRSGPWRLTRRRP